MMNIIKGIRKALYCAALAAAVSFASSCDKDENFGIKGGEEGISHNVPGNREEYHESRRVLLFYECGFNSLYSYLKDDMETELPKGYVPKSGRNEDVVLVYSKIAKNGYYEDVPSYLRRLYTNSEGEVVSDTLATYPASTIASSPETMTEVLTFVKDRFPAKGYGMVFSSHGSGWLPSGYYSNPTRLEYSYSKDLGKIAPMSAGTPDFSASEIENEDPYHYMVRSIGQDKMSVGSVEMSCSEFCSGIPYHLDFILFDMCFSAGIEVAYTLKDKADYIGGSVAEVLADGMFDYTKITSILFQNGGYDLESLFRQSFERYDSKTGMERSATVTLIRTNGLQNLADVCKEVFEKYREQIKNAPYNQIQRYFRSNRHFFYDLEDILVQSGVSEEDMETVRSAVKRAQVFRAATPSFMESFDITAYSGFSMYLPANGGTALNLMYKFEPWQQATELIK